MVWKMMLIPPTYVKRDGQQLRMDGVHHNWVFMLDTRSNGYVLNVREGSLLKLQYHPIDLAFKTRQPKLVWEGMCVKLEKRRYLVNLEFVRESRNYVENLDLLGALRIPQAIVPTSYIQIVEAFVRKVPAKELYQGVKTVFNIELPKMIQSYLNGGYHWEEKERSLECFVLQAMVEGGLVKTGS